jgi:hypothetical protein
LLIPLFWLNHANVRSTAQRERGREVYHFEASKTLEEDEEVFEVELG